MNSLYVTPAASNDVYLGERPGRLREDQGEGEGAGADTQEEQGAHDEVSRIKACRSVVERGANEALREWKS